MFSGRRRLLRKSSFLFPFQTANRHAVRSGKLHDVWHGQSLPYAHLPLNDALPGSRSFRVGRPPLIRQQQQQCCCYLIYKLPVLWRSGAAARWSRLHTPVETLTPPRRGKIRFTPLPPYGENCAPLLCPSSSRAACSSGLTRETAEASVSPLFRVCIKAERHGLEIGIYEVLRETATRNRTTFLCRNVLRFRDIFIFVRFSQILPSVLPA